jgi:error-prone DNA polymerase
MELGEQVVEDYAAMRLSLRAHPVALIRHLLTPSDTPPDTVSNAGPAWR